MLDRGGKGYLYKQDILDAFYACGLEPTPTELLRVLDLVGDERTAASLGLALSLGGTMESAEHMIRFYHMHGYQTRPDAFRHLISREYFFRRFLAYSVPLWSEFDTKNHLPNYTPYEQSLYKPIQSLSHLWTVYNTMLFVCWALYFSGATITTSSSELLALTLISWGLNTSQIAREAVIVAKERLELSHSIYRWMFSLRYSSFTLQRGEQITGVACLDFFTRVGARATSKTDAESFMLYSAQVTPVAHFNALAEKGRGGRRRSSIGEELAEITALHGEELGDLAFAHSKRKYNLWSLDMGKFVPFFVACGCAALPSAVGVLKGDRGATDADIAAGVMNGLNLFFSAFYTGQVVVKGALTETKLAIAWSQLVVGAIADGSERTSAANEEFGFRLRLNSRSAVENYEVLYRAVSASCKLALTYHTQALQYMSVVGIASVVVAFLSSVLDVEVDVWNIEVFLTGLIMLFVTAKVLTGIVKCDNLLHKAVVKMLQHQVRLNRVEIARDAKGLLGSEKVAEMKAANELIAALSESIDSFYAHQKLFGVVAMKQENLAKAGAGLGAALFTTALRQALNSRSE
ncbi:hypothetical protein TeGR_g4855 [Tetraparma gracilis]|uniref:EF-hand domain-containing protein n=1 Tax=Tetraparma gracilis TaxID=2962635 RepID=A0ABQ6MIQ9_9STRA|nr:hypothetical protein TeGR_g4855 [Tetraparma gracilis]